MGIINIAIIAVFALFVLSGIYKGFLWNTATLAATLIAVVLAGLLTHTVAERIVRDESLFSAMLSYTEGAEAIYDIELVDREISSLTNDEIDEIMERSGLPFPLRERVYENIMSEALKERGIMTLGEYFNESMVFVVINITSFLILYLGFRVALTLLISWADYSFKFPRLRQVDSVAGAAVGLVRGVIDVSVIFMLVPIVLTILPFESIEEMITTSAIASFLHRSNILLKLIPGIV